MPQTIYIIGHKSPDLDSVAAAISYAKLKNQLENTDIYSAAIAGALNQATEFILDKFAFAVPEIISDADGKKIILVDHNEAGQAIANLDKAEIMEIVDHHKLNFQYGAPIAVTIKPWGATCSLIAQAYFDNNIVLDKNLAGLLLAAILDDTVIAKSPTCTETDKLLIKRLAEIAGIADWHALGMDIFKIKSSIKNLSELEIIKNDFKNFAFKAGKFGIGQVEMVDLSEVDAREGALFEAMEKLRATEGYHSIILFFTDIINEGSRFLIVSGDEQKIEAALGKKLENHKTYIPGILSRKKQVVPLFSKTFDV